jgi:hypothetical protein
MPSSIFLSMTSHAGSTSEVSRIGCLALPHSLVHAWPVRPYLAPYLEERDTKTGTPS